MRRALDDALLVLGTSGVVTALGMLHFLWILAFLSPNNTVLIHWDSLGEFWLMDTPILILMTVFPTLLLLRAWRSAS